MLFVSFLPMVGFAYAYWDHGCEDPSYAPFGKLALLGLCWAVPHAGTMWLNAGLDHDDKPTLFGESVPVPANVSRYAYPTFAFAIGLAFWLDTGVGVCVVLCTILSILYSHPRTAWKGHAWGGPFVNAVGYGALSPLGGFLLSGFAPTIRGAVVLGVAVAWVSTAYFAAQAFQEEEDRERGYRTLVVVKGPAFTLRLTRALFWVAAGGTLALAAAGWFPRVVLVALPGFVWVDRLLVRWREQPRGGDETWARRFFLQMFWVALAVLVCVSIDYAWTRRETGLPGGLTTASGRFEPRACDR
jgi:1,4-dihydroxy-2-naphthoate octaprenyltransferase